METDLCWNELPTLCVSHILAQLPHRDALLASSTCQNWRAALSLYNGSRESLKLVAHRDHFKKNLFLAQLFRKHVRRLTVVLQCRSIELEKFVHFVLMRFCEAKALQDIMFLAAPQYMRFEEQATIEALRSVITEPLLMSQRSSLRGVALHGCGGLLPPRLQDPDASQGFHNLRRIAATNIRKSARPPPRPIRPYPFTYLQSVATDYDALDGLYMQALARLPHLRRLALNLYQPSKQPVPWRHLYAYYQRTVEVTLNIINLSADELDQTRQYVLARDMPLAAVRVFFCRTIDLEFVQTVVDQYSESLREFQWMDAPTDSIEDEPYAMIYDGPLPGTFINPFIMMCWQCTKLQKLVLHGYWMPAHDLLGMARLRPSLRRIEASALVPEDSRDDVDSMDMSIDILPFEMVHVEEDLEEVPGQFVAEMKQVLSYDWQPSTYSDMHPALTSETTKEQRYDYILQETMPDFTPPLPDLT